MKTAGVFCVMVPVVSLSACSQTKLPERPNIVFILTDDQGYGDLGYTGNPDIQTPNIDRLDATGVSFTDFHSATCSAPTRSGIMTGRSCNATGVWHTISGRSLLALDLPTLPQLMADGGYETGMFGKWHLGDNYPYHPHNRGFKEAWYLGGAGAGNAPDVWCNNYYGDTYFHNGEMVKTEGYCTDFWFEKAISFIDRNKEKPFFCYISTNAAHDPYNVERKYMDPYKNNENIVNPAFYGMISNIDRNVGQLMEYLEREKLLERTIVVFMTDNGTSGGAAFDRQGQVTRGYNALMRGKKGSHYEGGHRVPLILCIPGKKPEKITSLASYTDLLPTFLDLCGLDRLIPKDIEGRSLLPLLDKGDPETERFLCVDTQRKQYLEKGRRSCVMYKKWRLIDGKELYDLATDPSQKNNLYASFPDLVKKMKQEYEKWWVLTSVRADRFERIPVGMKEEPKVLLTTHDIHNDKNLEVPWNQYHVRYAWQGSGYWTLDVRKGGKYELSLYRWPPYTGLKINESAPAKEENWGFVPGYAKYRKGIPFTDLESITVEVDHRKVYEKKADPDHQCIRAVVELPEGPCSLQTDFVCASGKIYPAYFVEIKKINDK